MITAIDFLSLAQMKRVRHSHDIVVVSILVADEAFDRPKLHGFGGALTLEFEDTSLSQADLWAEADVPNPGLDSGVGTSVVGKAVPSLIRAPELRDAVAIDEFVMRHHAASEEMHLVVHCQAGIGRSAAVALWYSNLLRVPLGDDDMRSTDGANTLLLSLLEQVARERDDPTTVDSLSPVIY